MQNIFCQLDNQSIGGSETTTYKTYLFCPIFFLLAKRQITENAPQRVQGDCNRVNSSTGSARGFYLFYMMEEIVLFDELIISRDTVII